MQTAIVIVFINFLSAFIQAASGFGYAIFAMFLMLLFLPFSQCSVISAVVIVVIGLQMTLSLRKYIRPKKLLWPMLGLLTTFWPSLLLVRYVQGRGASRFMGVFLLLLTAFFLYTRKKRITVRETPLTGYLFGLLTGVTAGMFNIVGPLLALYYYDCCESTLAFKANLECSFLLAGMVSLILNILYVRPDGCLLFVSAGAGLAALAAGNIGLRVFYRVDRQMLKRIIVGVLPLMGLIQLFK